MTVLKSSLFLLATLLAISIFYIKNLKQEVLSQKELMLYARVEALEYKKKVAGYKNTAEYEAAKAEKAAADAMKAESMAMNAMDEAKRQAERALKALKDCNK